MKLPLKYFLLVSVLLGAVAIPWGYRYFQARREAEIEKLTNELEKLWANEPSEFPPVFGVRRKNRGQTVVESTWPIKGTFGPSAAHVDWRRQVEAIESRLEELTSKMPERPVSLSGQDGLTDYDRGY